MIFYCSLVFSPSTFYAIKTPQGFLTGPTLESTDFSNLNGDGVAKILGYWKATVDKELVKIGCKKGDLVYFAVVLSKLTNQIVKIIREACLICQMEAVLIEENGDSVVRYLKQIRVVRKDTLTVVNVNSSFVEIKTLLLEEQLGQKTGMELDSIDSKFINFIAQKYPQTRDILANSADTARDLLNQLKLLKNAFENGNQWSSGAYLIAIPPTLKHLFKQDNLEIKVEELRDIYEPFIQNILKVLAMHINNGYANDERFKLQRIKLLYVGRLSGYITARLVDFAKLNNLGIVDWPCEVEKMIMIGSNMALENNAKVLEGNTGNVEVDPASVPFKVPKLEEFFKSRDDPPVLPQNPLINPVAYPVLGSQVQGQRPLSNPVAYPVVESEAQRQRLLSNSVAYAVVGSELQRPYVQQPITIQRQMQIQQQNPIQQQIPIQQQVPIQQQRPIQQPIPAQQQRPIQQQMQIQQHPPVTQNSSYSNMYIQTVQQSEIPLNHEKQLPPPPSTFNPESTLKFETECLSETPSIPTLTLLYNLGADPSSSLHIAITTLNEPLFNFLLTLKIDLEWRDQDGNTPIHVACSCGTILMVQTLLPLVNIHKTNNSGSNIVICATQNEFREEVLKLVVRGGGDVRVVNRYGTGVKRAIGELDVGREEKEKLMRIVGL